jgi:2-methylfumaryl-CoA isomerase
MTLAQLGAQVIRVDDIRGAPDGGRWPLSRHGSSLFWSNLNKGVRSMAVDLRTPAGQDLVIDLITAPGDDAGLFIDNTIGRGFLADESLRARRADLVHVHIQWYADGRAAMDYAVNPRYGVPMLTRPIDSDRPVNHVLPAWDIATGLLAVSGLLSGLHRRATNGKGSRIDVALADVAASHVANLGWLAEAAERRGDRPRLGIHMYGAFGVDFVCADARRVMVVAITRQQWRDLMRITQTEEIFATLADLYEADFDVEGQRFENRAIIEAVLGPWFARRASAQVLQAAMGSRVMIGEFRSPHEVVEAFRGGIESDVLPKSSSPASEKCSPRPRRSGGTTSTRRHGPPLCSGATRPRFCATSSGCHWRTSRNSRMREPSRRRRPANQRTRPIAA